MRLCLWPQSLFGRLFAASIVALLLAQLVSMVFVARERERFILQGSVREWSRRIAEITTVLQGMDNTERAATVARLIERPMRFGHRARGIVLLRDGVDLMPELDRMGPRDDDRGPHLGLGPPLRGLGPSGEGAGPSARGEPRASARGESRAPERGPPGPPGAEGLAPPGLPPPDSADSEGPHPPGRPEDPRILLLR